MDLDVLLDVVGYGCVSGRIHILREASLGELPNRVIFELLRYLGGATKCLSLLRGRRSSMVISSMD